MVPTRMDPPEHTPYRKLLDTGLNLARIRDVEDKVRQTAIELIEEIAPRGHCDFSTDYAKIFPVKVFMRSEEHTSELQSLMRISYAVFCLKKNNANHHKIMLYK